jgi:acetyl esterase/lipase
MPDDTAEKLLKTIRKESPLEAQSIEQAREDLEIFYSRFRSEQDISVETVPVEHISAFWISTLNTAKDHVILFFHGGGFTVGSTNDHLDLCGKLSSSAGCRILSIDYRLAPEFVFPAALNDCVRSYLWLIEHGVSPSLIVPTGISAGGNLVLSMLMKLRETGIPLPKTAVLMSPAVDLASPGRSLEKNGEKDWLAQPTFDMLKKAYVRRHDPKDPLVSPIYGDLRGLPSLFIQAGTHEVLYDDVADFVRKAQKAGVDVTFDTWEGMFHCWQIFSSVLPEGGQAIDSIGGYIKKVFQSG